MTPYYVDDWVTVYCADSAEVLPGLRGDAIVTDPPYNVTLDADIALKGRAPMARNFGDWDKDWDVDEFLYLSARCVPPGGSMLAFTSDKLLSRYLAHRRLSYESQIRGRGLRGRGTTSCVRS